MRPIPTVLAVALGALCALSEAAWAIPQNSRGGDRPPPKAGDTNRSRGDVPIPRNDGTGLPQRPGAPLPPTTASDPADNTPDGERAGRDPTPDTIHSLWQYWWERNRDAYLPASARQSAPGGHELRLLDPDWRERRRKDYRPDAVTALLPLLQDDDQGLRGAAAIALAQTGDRDALASLPRMLGDTNPLVRDRTLLAMAAAGGSPLRYHTLRIAAAHPAAAPAARGRMDPDRLRSFASLFLALRGEGHLQPFLEDAVLDRRLARRYRALLVKSLGVARDASAVPLLVALLRDRREPTLVRCAAAEALGQIGDRIALEELVRLLAQRDPDADVRISAALAVGMLATSTDQDAVRSLLRAAQREGNSSVCRFLLLSLGRIGGTSIEAYLQQQFHRGRGEQRLFAALGLGLLCRSGSSPLALVRLVEGHRLARSLDEKMAILAALGLSGRHGALETLQEAALTASSPDERRVAVEAIRLLGQATSAPVLRRVLDEESSPDVVAAAAEALGFVDAAAFPVLVRLLADSRERSLPERTALIQAMGRTHDPQAIPVLLDLIADRALPRAEREAAVWALGMVFDGSVASLTAPLGFDCNFLRESSELRGLLVLSR